MERVDVEAHANVSADTVSDAAAPRAVMVDALRERSGAGRLGALVVQPVPRRPAPARPTGPLTCWVRLSVRPGWM